MSLYRKEGEELSLFRGLAFAALFCVPLWALVGLAIMGACGWL